MEESPDASFWHWSGETLFRLVKLMFCSLYFKIGLRAFIVGTLELLIKKRTENITVQSTAAPVCSRHWLCLQAVRGPQGEVIWSSRSKQIPGCYCSISLLSNGDICSEIKFHECQHTARWKEYTLLYKFPKRALVIARVLGLCWHCDQANRAVSCWQKRQSCSLPALGCGSCLWALTARPVQGQRELVRLDCLQVEPKPQ